MRVMLGKDNHPSLLVDVESGNYPTKFTFWVVNGAWSGCFDDGHITVDAFPNGDHPDLAILCDNQDRLCGEYQDVFDNWDNPDYVAPKPEPLPASYWDDFDSTIPF